MTNTAHAVKQHPLGFFQLDPIPARETLSVFYQSHYYDPLRKGGRADDLRQLLDVGDEHDGELAWLQTTLYRDLADAIAPFVDGREVLDVGCGAGDFIRWLHQEGFRAAGVDPSTEAVATAVARGADAHCATLEDWSRNEQNLGRYGGVTLVNVLEHVPDPLEVLRIVRTLLAEDGVVSVRVPNDFSPLQAAAEPTVERQRWWITAPDHINYFNVPSLSAAYAASGFQVVDVTTDFPMEYFLLMGINYVDDATAGRQAHTHRRRFEAALPKELRQKLNRAHAAVGVGRNLLVTARRD